MSAERPAPAGGPNGAPPLRLPHPLHRKIPQSVVRSR